MRALAVGAEVVSLPVIEVVDAADGGAASRDAATSAAAVRRSPCVHVGERRAPVLRPRARRAPAQRDFVADPATGSRHNRGCAVDLTLYSLATGLPIEMPGTYDEFSDRSHPDYPGGTSLQRWHRDLLRWAMEREGFTVYSVEWWHFDYVDWREYPVLNLTFEELSP